MNTGPPKVSPAQPIMRLGSGENVWPSDPARTRVRAVDMFTGLRHQRRYGGHIDVPVLAHLALCARMAAAAARWVFPDRAIHRKVGDAEREAQRALVIACAAAHDLHEAYWPDYGKPYRETMPAEAKKWWNERETAWQGHVYQQLGLPWPVPREIEAVVVQVDFRAVAVEAVCWNYSRRGEFTELHGGPVVADEARIGNTIKGMGDLAWWEIVTRAIRVVVPTVFENESVLLWQRTGK